MKTEHQNYEHLDAMFDKRTARGIEVNDPLADALEREHETGLVEDLHAIAEIPIGDLPSGHHESESVLTKCIISPLHKTVRVSLETRSGEPLGKQDRGAPSTAPRSVRPQS